MLDEVPRPDKIMEEPLRALLAVVECAVYALQNALDAEYPEPLSDDELLPQAPDQWTAEALAGQLESVRSALGLYELALKRRNTFPIPRASETPSDL